MTHMKSHNGGIFAHKITLSQDVMNNLARKYRISNIYNYRVPSRGE